MKRIFSLALGLALCTFAIAQDAPATPADGSKIEFTKTENDFGNIKSGSPVSAEFEFVNKGTAPPSAYKRKGRMWMYDAKLAEEPIAPGEKGTIQATYNNAGAGAFNKSVTVTTQGGETVVLFLKGVAEAPSGDNAVAPTITPIEKQ